MLLLPQEFSILQPASSGWHSGDKIKQYFRRNSNDRISANLHSKILSSVQLNVLPIERIWKVERESRDYRRMCKDAAKNIADGKRIFYIRD